MKDLSQEGGSGSVNMQAGGNVNIALHNGVTATEVTTIALAIARDNMTQLKGYAQELVDTRVEHLVERFIDRINEHPRARLDAVRDPDIQYSLLIAEKEFARSGDENMAKLLVDLLVNRCALEGRGLQALVLNEAIDTVARLTSRQINTLTASWLVSRVADSEAVDSIASYADWLAKHVDPFMDISGHQSEYDHLAFLGCISFEGTNRRFGDIVGRVYPGAFAGGFHEEGISPELRDYTNLFKPCANEADRLQVAAVSLDQMIELAETNSLNPEETAALRNTFRNNVLSEWKVEERLIAAYPPMGEFIRQWNSSKMLTINVTSVGLAIAHANWARSASDSAELSVWIPEGI